MATRHCDGSDPNLTRTIPAADFDPATMTRSPWDDTARPGTVIICCTCDLVFEDRDRRVTYPHPLVNPRLS